jgi:6,7-dimethyl-8-ribityllumazine synthase
MASRNQASPNYREITGDLSAKGLRLAVVVSRFNAFVTERLLNGALDALTRSGARADDVHVVRVPGAMEIPLAAQHLAESGRYDAIVCLGAVIRGETPHFDYVCAESARGVAQASLRAGVPMSYGILTVENLEQAVDRAGLKSGNKGFEAAMGAVEMANLIRQIGAPQKPAGRKRTNSARR